MDLLKVAQLTLVLVGMASSYTFYRDQIPNGYTVPDPCDQGIWDGVGHQAEAGGGPRNAFGVAFAANNFVWTPALCNQDSDEDGQTNGAELGDPQCIWTPGSTPARPAISHPGICEPLTTVFCQARNTWLYCNPAVKV
jgi:dopamine beta-monooxygenase